MPVPSSLSKFRTNSNPANNSLFTTYNIQEALLPPTPPVVTKEDLPNLIDQIIFSTQNDTALPENFNPSLGSEDPGFQSLLAEISKPEYGFSPQELLTLKSKSSGELAQILLDTRNKFETSLEQKQTQQAKQTSVEDLFNQQFPELLTNNQTGFVDDLIAELNLRGLSGEDFRGQATTEADRIGSLVPTEFGTDVQSFFNPNTLIEDIYNTELRSLQQNNVNALTNEFGYLPSFGSNTFGNTYDDSIINSIIDKEKQNSIDFLTRAFNRGQLNQEGYNAALADLDTQSTSAFSQAQGLGGDILTSAQGDISSLLGEIESSANSADFNSQFSSSDSIGRVNSLIDSLTSTIPGQLQSTIGNAIKFDPQQLLNVGGIKQGSIGNRQQQEPSSILSLLANNTQNKSPATNAKKQSILGF